MIPDFTQIFNKHNTDKGSQFYPHHDLGDFYLKNAPQSPDVIIEIGVDRGGSLLAWKEIYPDALVIGVDINAKVKVFPEGIVYIEGNACNHQIIEQIFNLFSNNKNVRTIMIIDDGSHVKEEQIIVYNLFREFISNLENTYKVYYFIEDVFYYNLIEVANHINQQTPLRDYMQYKHPHDCDQFIIFTKF